MEAQRFRNINLEFDEEVACIIFNRPDQLNAMNSDMMDEIIQAIKIIEKNEKIKVATFKGNGKAFMAGADIKEYAKQTTEQFEVFQKKGFTLYDGIIKSRKPWIALVNGYALGGGFEIVLACDLVLASKNAQMGLPEVFLGLIPGGGGTQRLANKIGLNRTKQMLYMGDSLDAETLHNWGLVNEVYDELDFESESNSFVQRLVRRSTDAIAELKRLANLSVDAGVLNQNIVDEGESCARLFLREESRLLIQKFISKSNKTD